MGQHNNERVHKFQARYGTVPRRVAHRCLFLGIVTRATSDEKKKLSELVSWSKRYRRRSTRRRQPHTTMFGSSGAANNGSTSERSFSLPRLTGRNSPVQRQVAGGGGSAQGSPQRSSLFNLVMTRVQHGPSSSSTRIQNSADVGSTNATPSRSSGSIHRSQPAPSLSRTSASPVPPPPVVYLTPQKQPQQYHSFPSTDNAQTPACTPDDDDRAASVGPLVYRSVTYNDAIAHHSNSDNISNPGFSVAHLSPSPSSKPVYPRSVGSQWCAELQCLQVL